MKTINLQKRIINGFTCYLGCFLLFFCLPSFGQPGWYKAINCGDEVDSSNYINSQFNSYPGCSSLTYPEPDVSYQITVSIPTTLTLTLTPQDPEAEFHLFVLDAGGNCIEWAQATIPGNAFSLITNLIPVSYTPTPFYIVIDGTTVHGLPGKGAFHLKVECDTCITCENPCPGNVLDSIHTGLGAIGSFDPNWSIIEVPGPPLCTAGYTLGDALISNWTSLGWNKPMPYTNWISNRETGPATDCIGDFTFQRTFYIDTNLCPHPKLNLCVSVDDIADVYLNGLTNHIGTAASQHTATPMGCIAGFVSGFNTLTVNVHNGPIAAYMGLDVRGWICCDDSISVIQCGQTVQGANSPILHGNTVSVYNCSSTLSNLGPEAIYEFSLESTSMVTASYTTGSNFLKIYILDSKPIGTASATTIKACGDRFTPAMTGIIGPGTYYVYVDSPNWSDVSGFTFVLNCENVIIPVCSDTCIAILDRLHSGLNIAAGHDVNWKITAVPLTYPTLLTSNALPVPWITLGAPFPPPMAVSSWIGPDPCQQHGGDFTFQRDFYIDTTCLPPQFPELKLCILACDADVYIGPSGSASPVFIGSVSSVTVPVSLSTALLTTPGFNRLTIILHNTANYYPVIDVKGFVCCGEQILPYDSIGCGDSLRYCQEDWHLLPPNRTRSYNYPYLYYPIPAQTNHGPDFIYKFTGINSWSPAFDWANVTVQLWDMFATGLKVYIIDYTEGSPLGWSSSVNTFAWGDNSRPAQSVLQTGKDYWIVVHDPNARGPNYPLGICFQLTIKCEPPPDCDSCDDVRDVLHTGFQANAYSYFTLVNDSRWQFQNGSGSYLPAYYANAGSLGWCIPMNRTSYIFEDGAGISPVRPASAGATSYMFRYNFNIPSNCNNYILKLCVTSDDQVDFYTGNNTGPTSPLIATASGYNCPATTITIPSILVTGNWLYVKLINTPLFFSGFDLKGYVCCKDNQDLKDVETMKQVDIYPNPADNYFDLEASENINLLELYNLQGKKVGEYSQLNKKARISTIHLPPGFYFLMIKIKDKVYMEKLIIER